MLIIYSKRTFLISGVSNKALQGNYIALPIGPFVGTAYWFLLLDGCQLRRSCLLRLLCRSQLLQDVALALSRLSSAPTPAGKTSHKRRDPYQGRTIGRTK